MTLPASGAISFSNVDTELGFSSTAQISLNDTAVRTLFGVSSGAISMSNGYGKSNITYYYGTIFSGCNAANYGSLTVDNCGNNYASSQNATSSAHTKFPVCAASVSYGKKFTLTTGNGWSAGGSYFQSSGSHVDSSGNSYISWRCGNCTGFPLGLIKVNSSGCVVWTKSGPTFFGAYPGNVEFAGGHAFLATYSGQINGQATFSSWNSCGNRATGYISCSSGTHNMLDATLGVSKCGGYLAMSGISYQAGNSSQFTMGLGQIAISNTCTSICFYKTYTACSNAYQSNISSSFPIIKYDCSKNIYVSATFGADGGAIPGCTYGNHYNPGFSFQAKFNSSGSPQWFLGIGPALASNQYYQVTGMVVDTSANSYVLTSRGLGGNANDYLLYKLNSSGTLQWIRRIYVSSSYTGAYNLNATSLIGGLLALDNKGALRVLVNLVNGSTTTGYHGYFMYPTDGSKTGTLSLKSYNQSVVVTVSVYSGSYTSLALSLSTTTRTPLGGFNGSNYASGSTSRSVGVTAGGQQVCGGNTW